MIIDYNIWSNVCMYGMLMIILIFIIYIVSMDVCPQDWNGNQTYLRGNLSL